MKNLDRIVHPILILLLLILLNVSSCTNGNIFSRDNLAVKTTVSQTDTPPPPEGRPPGGQEAIPDPSPANNAVAKAVAENKFSDITDKQLTNRSPNCADYAGAYTAHVTNLGGGPKAIVDDPVAHHDSAVYITVNQDDSGCTLISDDIPSHDFNDKTAGFRDPVNEVGQKFNIPANPQPLAETTPITQESYDGVMLNGVPINILTAGCY